MSVLVSRFLLVRRPFKIFILFCAYCVESTSFYSAFLVGKDFFEEEPEVEEDPVAIAATAAAQAAQAEKRRLRKEASAAAALSAAPANTVDLPSVLIAPTEAVAELVSSSQGHEKPQPKQAHVRGKSGQRKKMKEKYRDQGVERATVPVHPF